MFIFFETACFYFLEHSVLSSGGQRLPECCLVVCRKPAFVSVFICGVSFERVNAKYEIRYFNSLMSYQTCPQSSAKHIFALHFVHVYIPVKYEFSFVIVLLCVLSVTLCIS